MWTQLSPPIVSTLYIVLTRPEILLRGKRIFCDRARVNRKRMPPRVAPLRGVCMPQRCMGRGRQTEMLLEEWTRPGQGPPAQCRGDVDPVNHYGPDDDRPGPLRVEISTWTYRYGLSVTEIHGLPVLVGGRSRAILGRPWPWLRPCPGRRVSAWFSPSPWCVCAERSTGRGVCHGWSPCVYKFYYKIFHNLLKYFALVAENSSKDGNTNEPPGRQTMYAKGHEHAEPAHRPPARATGTPR